MPSEERRRRTTHPVVQLEQLQLARLHRVQLIVVSVIVAEHVEDAVDDEQGELVVDRASVAGGLLDGDGRAHHDVTEQHGDVGTRRARNIIQWEREHVGRPSVAEVLGVQRGDLVPADERQRQLARATAVPHHRARQSTPPVDIHHDVDLLVAANHLDIVEGWTRRVVHRSATESELTALAPVRRRIPAALVRRDDVGDDPVAHDIGR